MNFVIKIIIVRIELKVKNFTTISIIFGSFSKYLFTKEYQPQKATNKRAESLFGIISKDRIAEEKYTDRAKEVPNSIRINVTSIPASAEAV